VRPDGTPRRVFLGVKVGRSAPRVDGTSGLALDSKGTIYFGAGVPGLTGGGGAYQVMRLDETRGTPVLVAGAPRPTDVSLGDGPARQAYFGRFKSICLSPDDTLYVNDDNLVIRKLRPAGLVTTWAF
jgi:sugar lactone lactonase YvrE